MNKLYRELNSNNILAQFEQFRASFQGDPKEEVQKLLNSGQMSQETFNKLSEQAMQLQRILTKRL